MASSLPHRSDMMNNVGRERSYGASSAARSCNSGWASGDTSETELLRAQGGITGLVVGIQFGVLVTWDSGLACWLKDSTLLVSGGKPLILRIHQRNISWVPVVC